MEKVTVYKDSNGKYYESEDEYNLSMLKDEYLTLIWEYERSLQTDSFGSFMWTPEFLIKQMLHDPEKLRNILDVLSEKMAIIRELENKINKESIFAKDRSWWEFWK